MLIIATSLLATPAAATAVAPLDALRDSSPRAASAARYEPGQVVVRFSGRAGVAARRAAAQAVRGHVQRRLPLPGVRVLALDAGVSVRAALGRLRGRADVVWAEPNFVRRLHGISNDAFLREQWGLHATGQLVGRFRSAAPDVDVDAPEAWDVTTGRPDVTVAVVDSGISPNHPDLAPNIAPGGHDFLDGDSDPFDPTVGLSHGSLVSSIIAARSGDGAGVAGVAPGVRILPLRVAGLDGTLTSADAAAAYTYAASHGARIVNASFGGFGISQVELDAIRAAPSTLFVASSGNDAVNTDFNPVAPCVLDAPNVICVAASDLDDSLADFSNFGAATVDLLRPGGGDPGCPAALRRPVRGRLRGRPVRLGGGRGQHLGPHQRRRSGAAASAWPTLPSGDYPNDANHAIRTASAVEPQRADALPAGPLHAARQRARSGWGGGRGRELQRRTLDSARTPTAAAAAACSRGPRRTWPTSSATRPCSCASGSSPTPRSPAPAPRSTTSRSSAPRRPR